MTLTDTLRPTPPLWQTTTVAAGLAWNIFGLYQFALSLTSTTASLMAKGMTEAQATVMTTYPVWMTLAFALGVGLGTLGSVLLLVRRKLALPVLMVSLIAYVALWAGDAMNGVFTALGAPQVIVLTFVVAIAAGLLLLARHADRRGQLA
jgi:hypothetical protein